MHYVASLPSRKVDTAHHWGGDPLQALTLFLQELTFSPVKVTLWLERNYQPVAELLGLRVPFQGEQGTLEISPGYSLTYTWGSFDGRATDYLTLAGGYSASELKALVARIQSVMPIVHRTDLEIIVESAPVAA